MPWTPHTETDDETGLTLKIESDDDCAHLDPTDDEEAVIFAVLHRRYVNPAKDHGLTSVEAIAAFEEANAGDDSEWFVLPLWLYDHSGTVYRAGAGNPFSCPWDSGRVGIIALKRSEWGSGSESAEKLTEYAESFCRDYTDFANGNCFGYVIEDEDGDELQASWGYLGDYDDPGNALEAGRAAFAAEVTAAKARRAAETAAANEAGARALEEARPDLYA